MCLLRYNHPDVVHGIAQLAFFRNGLTGLLFVRRISLRGSLYQLMLVGIYHILPRSKADQ